MATRMQQRRGTAAQWAAANPVLADGEVGYEKDTGVVKIGNGSSTWNQLPAILNGAYLPLNGKAYDADRLDGLDSTAFAQKNYVDGLITPAGASRSLVNHFGSVTVYPTVGVKLGDRCYRSDLRSEMYYNGTTWQQLATAVMTQAQRLALVTANLPAPFTVRESDTNERPVWDGGTVWEDVWTSYTPTWTCTGTGAVNPTLGNGTLVGRYRKSGRKIEVRISLLFGSSTNGGVGPYRFTLPFTTATAYQQAIGTAKCYTTNGSPWTGHTYAPANNGYVEALFPVSASNVAHGTAANAAPGNATGTGTPAVTGAYTFGTTGDIQIYIVYETSAS